MKFLTSAGLVFAVLMALFVSGCASAPKPTTELALAKESIQRAKVNNAYEIAPQEIRDAESKLTESLMLIEEEENEEATLLLRQAHLDAEAAIAKVDESRALESLEELKASMQELEKQLKDQQ